MDPWRIELLGQLRAARGGQALTRFRSEKTAALLGRLALEVGSAQARELLVETFWPDGEPEAGRNNLSKSLSALRAQLEPPGTPAGAVIVATRATVQLDPRAVRTDVAAFEADLALAATSAGAERRAALERACAVYRGDLLPACFHDWVRAPRERLRAASLAAGQELIALLRAADEPQRAIERALALLGVDPFAQEVSRQLLELYAQVGEPVAALRHYEELVARLEEELGVTPTPELMALARRIERALSPAARQARSSESGLASSSGRLRAAPAPPPPLTGQVALLALVGEGVPAALPLAQAQGGRSLRLEGGAALFAFGAPRAALACALAARQAAGPLQAGLDVGELEAAPAQARVRALAAAAHPGQVLASEAAVALLRRDPDLELVRRDLGLYRLEGAGSERLFQLDERGAAPAVFPEPRAECLTSKPGLSGLSRFFGREEELQRARAALEAGTRLVTFTGPGGIGKTRLAQELAHQLTAAHAGAVWFVPLAALTDPAALPAAVADALGLPGAEQDPLARIAEHLGGRPALLVLDNLEHLREAAAAFLLELLPAAPGLACLATSRALLGVEGEQELPLAPFPVPVPDAGLKELAGLASVRLLVDRAQRVDPGFELGARNAAGVAELVRRLEGIPLALTLAAGRLQALAPVELLERLTTPLDLPASRSRGLPARHRTLRAAIEGSYRLLSAPLQRFFAHLSAFRGGFTLEAAEAVCEEPLALDRLCELREVSLVVSQRGPAGTRFGLLETLREFAREQLNPAAQRALARRHALYYTDLARRAHADLEGPAQAEWLARLDAELENVRAAFQPPAVDPEWARAHLVLASCLCRFWETRLRLREGRRLTEQALAGAPEPSPERVEALLMLGHLAVRQGDREAVRARVSEGAALARQLDRPGSLSRALCILGTNALDEGDWGEAQARFEEFLAAARQAGEPRHEAIALLNLSMVLSNRGDYRAALSAGEQARALLRAQGNDAARTYLEVMLGDAERMLGRPARAKALIEGALADLRRLQSAFGTSIALASLADVELGLGELEAAEAHYREALVWSQAGEDHRTRTTLLMGLADVAHQRGDRAAERALLAEAEALAGPAESRFLRGNLAADLARLAHAEGDLPRARARWEECLRELGALGAKGTLTHCLEGRARLARAEGDLARAASLWGAVEAHRARQETPRPPRHVEDAARELTLLREALGSAAFQAAWEAGRALSWEQAVALGLRADPRLDGAAS